MNQLPSFKLFVQLPERVGISRWLRLWSQSLFETMGVSQQDIDSLSNIIGELGMNVERHAHSDSKTFRVYLEGYNDRVTIRVEDDGVGFDQEEIPMPGTERPDGQGGIRIGGFGLMIVKGASSWTEIKSACGQGTSVEAHLMRHDDKDPEPKI